MFCKFCQSTNSVNQQKLPNMQHSSLMVPTCVVVFCQSTNSVNQQKLSKMQHSSLMVPTCVVVFAASDQG